MRRRKKAKHVAAGRKAAKVRWAPRDALLLEIRKKYGDDKKMADWFQFEWNNAQLAELVKWIKKSE